MRLMAIANFQMVSEKYGQDNTFQLNTLGKVSIVPGSAGLAESHTMLILRFCAGTQL